MVFIIIDKALFLQVESSAKDGLSQKVVGSNPASTQIFNFARDGSRP